MNEKKKPYQEMQVIFKNKPVAKLKLENEKMFWWSSSGTKNGGCSPCSTFPLEVIGDEQELKIEEQLEDWLKKAKWKLGSDILKWISKIKIIKNFYLSEHFTSTK